MWVVVLFFFEERVNRSTGVHSRGYGQLVGFVDLIFSDDWFTYDVVGYRFFIAEPFADLSSWLLRANFPIFNSCRESFIQALLLFFFLQQSNPSI